MRYALPGDKSDRESRRMARVLDLTSLEKSDISEGDKRSRANIIPHPDNPKKCQAKGCRAWRKKKYGRYCGWKHQKEYSSKTNFNAQARQESFVRRKAKRVERKMQDIRDLYRNALGDQLSKKFDAMAQDDFERINLAAEVDLSRLTVAETTEAVLKLLDTVDDPKARVQAMSLMRKAIRSHADITKEYMAIAEKAAVATPERMKRFFEELKAHLIYELVDGEDTSLFDRVWAAINTVDLPDPKSTRTVEIEIT